VCSLLFRYEAYPAHGLDEAGGLLWQMMCFTGETFKPEQLEASKRASMYFNENGEFI
jgi:serine/threonine-protein kinase SRPK3